MFSRNWFYIFYTPDSILIFKYFALVHLIQRIYFLYFYNHKNKFTSDLLVIFYDIYGFLKDYFRFKNKFANYCVFIIYIILKRVSLEN